MKRITRFTDTFWELGLWFAAVLSVATTLFHYAEARSWGDSVWWSFVTAMTVGYGDISPVTLVGRIDAIVLMTVVPLFLVPILIVRMMNEVIENRDSFTHEEQEYIKRQLKEIWLALQAKQ